MALAALIVIERFETVFVYPFLFFPAFSRSFGLQFGGFAKQDEVSIPATLGLGKYTVAIIVCSAPFGLVWRGSRKLKLAIPVIYASCVASVAALLMVVGTHRLLS